MNKEEEKKNPKFYNITQNNSGGSWDVNDNLCHELFIEADNEEEAEEKALELGVYFEGVEDGKDCNCCGDRWSRFFQEIQIPYRYGTFGLTEANKLAKEYGASVEQTTWRYLGTHDPDPDSYDLVFDSVENYAKMLTKKYGSTTPNARVFYKDGTVKEF